MAYYPIIKTEDEYKEILDFLHGEKDVKFHSRHKKLLTKKKASLFINQENILYFKGENGEFKKVFITSNSLEMKMEVKKLHEISHLGMNKIEDLCNKLFFRIPRFIIREVVNSCITCLQSQPLKTADKMMHITAKRTAEIYQIDLIDLSIFSAENNGNKWILTVIDVFSKFGFTKAIENKSAETVINALQEFFFKHGPPLIIQSDNGKEFKNEKMVFFVKNLKYNKGLVVLDIPNHKDRWRDLTKR